MKAIRNSKGFTLIELLVVVAIIGILAAIAIPQFALYRQKGFDSRAESDLRNAATAEESLFASSSVYTGCNDATACDRLEHLSWREALRPTSATRRSGLLLTVAIAGLAFATAWTDRQLAQRLTTREQAVEFIYVPPTPFLRAVSLRYERALADIL